MTVNGRVVPLAGTVAHATALDWLRGIGLTGAKEGCAEGECGACAVLVSTAADGGGTTWTAVNACLVPVHALDGQEVVTAEGLGSPEALHPVQEELAAGGGSQCGYCTPGFACAMAAEFYRPDRAPQEASPERGPNGFDLHAIGGNLCRCTGYRPIRDAAYALGMPQDDDPLRSRSAAPAPPAVATDVHDGTARFVRPETLDEALRLLRDEPEAVAVAGSTDWGVDVNLRAARAPVVVAIDRLAELRTLEEVDGSLEIGAGLTLTELEQRLDHRVPLLPELMPQFASRLIRNRATLGGSLGTASPIGDAAPVLLALGARVVLVSADAGEREVDLADYFTGYRASVRRHDELIRAVRIPLGAPDVCGFHKATKRRFDDVSSVAVAVALDLDDGVISDARIGLGGVAATPIRASATEEALVGRPWTAETAAAASVVLEREGTPLDDHRASAAYRARMLGTALPALFAAGDEDAEATA
ncbi:xanthine dehydrogenase small subunit [Microbacterium hibisci]|uniref:xanthine dehydrogenase small subunit n=1 Tax=Microbacterium hibisci TaxID=2036000 RepID=UPI0019411F93|nr:FAD binding domain-containing protein [Microbacterium hibisci]